ncbi:phosphatidylinositol kinase [Nocardioides flavus (ex Wang et al. 2016)]|uniref:Phosphatidylinositol kinase n=1 Tax=Nocardioides flavus (ex Wang et al. 2016) TaxID=2058780 RepID=A0ABQ3HLV1_9ACTN|nr:SCO1664 family protein [Nocardioides flavus (ex Wang et al. 2016)]GHE18665.1 phosphatidylinositol kinase [Nocardioides flavus (ex Wang et al. 2016)]
MTPDPATQRPAGFPTGELTLHGRVLPASNATFVGEIDGVRVVYKPIAGERPLWDFPDGTLAAREVGAYAVSEALGWDIVPPTVLGDGPHGPGMVQLWRDEVEDVAPVDIVAEDAVPEGYRHVFDGLDAHDQPVSLVHEDSAALRRMALFDVVVNNADRKGGHVLPMPDGHRHGVDHGLTFHVEHKLRTVLWGFVGEPVSPEEVDGLHRLASALDGDLGTRLATLLRHEELATTQRRLARLLATGTFPAPATSAYPVIPWPPF